MILCFLDPHVQVVVLREEVHDGFVGYTDVFWIAREGNPSEWTLPIAEELAHKGGNESWEVECIGYASMIARNTADVIAVVKRDRTAFLELQHCLHVLTNTSVGFLEVCRWI